jgi:hypothetical protein
LTRDIKPAWGPASVSVIAPMARGVCLAVSPFKLHQHFFKGEFMGKGNSMVAVYSTHTAAEVAIQELHASGFEMKKLSIIGRDFHTDEHVVGYYNTGDRMQVWGKTGAFWGGLWGLLFGSAFFWVPGIGPLLVAGPLVSWIVGALEGALLVGGLSAIGAGLYGLGIPKDSILRYETALKTGKFVLIAHGSIEDVDRAKAILHHTLPETLDHHAQEFLVEQPV